MPSNLDRYKKDLDSLTNRGEDLSLAMQAECFPEQFERGLKKDNNEAFKKLLKNLPSFRETYQSWYSEARVVVEQLLPGRLSDFVGHYEKPKTRKDITSENYKILDYLQGSP
jgi:hypothetical protein